MATKIKNKAIKKDLPVTSVVKFTGYEVETLELAKASYNFFKLYYNAPKEEIPINIVKYNPEHAIRKTLRGEDLPPPTLEPAKKSIVEVNLYNFGNIYYGKTSEMLLCKITGVKYPKGTLTSKVVTSFGSNFTPIIENVPQELTFFLPEYLDSRGTIYLILPEVIERYSSDLLEHSSGVIHLKGTKVEKTFNFNKFNHSFNASNFLDRNQAYKLGCYSPAYISTLGMPYTFGVELEASISFLPTYKTYNLNMSCVRDGSLNKHIDNNIGGPEYVTGVLTGDAGMLQLQRICSTLSPISEVNDSCGIHVHIGGMRVTKEFALAMYETGRLLQQDLFKMVPESRRINEYCRKLKPLNLTLPYSDTTNYKSCLDASYDLLIEHVAGITDNLVGKSKVNSKELSKKERHPLGIKCGYNHKSSRYEWLNLVPLLFNDKGKEVYTVEFRPHSASFNYSKIRNWVLISMCIVKYVENNYLTIAKKSKENTQITIEEIITSTLPETKTKELLTYIKNRKALFNTVNKSIEDGEYLKESYSENKRLTTLKELCV